MYFEGDLIKVLGENDAGSVSIGMLRWWVCCRQSASWKCIVGAWFGSCVSFFKDWYELSFDSVETCFGA